MKMQHLQLVVFCSAIVWAKADALLATKHLNLTQSNSITFLDRRNISQTAHKLGLKIRWFSDDQVQRDPAERSEMLGPDHDSEMYPPFLRKSRFALHLRERHKWSTYGKGADKILASPSTGIFSKTTKTDTADNPDFGSSKSSSTRGEDSKGSPRRRASGLWIGW
eukprot:CAMPEP_0172153816 /NCGR_PEP_ID=MMETSP1050-20130122/1675_1 /TAXON_ID=233186 /ORGANISM="Cryptomonas curvata, Strain CCAP979/52" /LENGTH=164 /DNA_ID=CAMNT_0012822435 /DNA_START=16 /DNA_END=507 /DNA_ORIENTATION=+